MSDSESAMERNREEKRFIWGWDWATVLTKVVNRGHPKKVIFRIATVSEERFVGDEV